ncbi:MAG: YD repeat-containing protein, partial [Lachnospiraceae bacterium]|nr:YD repeat-containing protein [Lachnospiraceae bacterium]
TYDSMGQVKTVIDPLANQTSYSYDNAGRITSITDTLGNTRSYTYDALGNLLRKDVRGDTSTTQAKSRHFAIQ